MKSSNDFVTLDWLQPISLIVVDYDVLTSESRNELTLGNNGVLQLPDGRLGETRRCVAAAVQTESINYYNPTLVLASNLFVSNSADVADLSDLNVRLGANKPQTAAFDQPIVLTDLPPESGHYVMAISFSLNQVVYKTKALVEYKGPAPGTSPAPPQRCGLL